MADVKHRRSRRLWLAAGMGVVVAGVVAVVVIWPRHTGRPPAPEDPAAELCWQSEAACRAGNFREALALADRAIQAAPDRAPGYARRARAKYFLGDDEGTLADCDAAIARDLGYRFAYAYRAPVAGLRSSPVAGVADAETAVEGLPDSAEVLACAALAQLQAGDRATAWRLADRAVNLAPDDAEAYRVRGLVLEAQGDDAKGEFDEAVRLSADRPFYLAARADYLVRFGQTGNQDAAVPHFERALKDIDRALKADPACAAADLAAARLWAVRERRPDVLAACETAVAANPRLVDAYLRAAEDLSPKDLKHFDMLQEALAQPLDLREMRGGDFTFGALLANLQRMASARIKEPVIIYISFNSFPEEQRAQLRDVELNLNHLMDISGENLLKAVTFKVILHALCEQVGATFFVGPEYIEIVNRATAAREADRRARLVSYDLIAPAELYRRQKRVLLFEQALRQSIDLRELKGGDFAFGAILTDVCRLTSKAMGTDVPFYIKFNSFPQERRATLRDAKVNLNVLMDATGENLLPAVKVGTILDQIVRQAGDDVTFRAAPDYIEIVGPGYSDDWYETTEEPFPNRLFRRLAAMIADGGVGPDRPPRLHGRPRTEAIRWLTQGIEQVPESARLYRARGQVYLEQYDLDAAIADLTRALERNPADKAVYRLRSLAYAARGNPGDGDRARADALATKP